MVKFWMGKAGSGKEECYADDQEQKGQKSRYSSGCCGVAVL